jgi:hypothetical protein
MEQPQERQPERQPERQSVKMRQLAARLRRDAGMTSILVFRCKMENAASELEEAAVDMESRDALRPH